MARFTFGAKGGEYLADRNNRPQAGVTITFYDAETGGTQQTDLLDSNGTPVTSVTSGVLGTIPTFQGPDGVSLLWADAGGGHRILLDARDDELPNDAALAAVLEDAGSASRAVLTDVVEQVGSGTYARIGRPSLYLVDYLTDGASAAANRTAFQAAITAAEAAGKALCVDGAFLTFSGEAVTATADDFTLWASSTSTHRLTNSTRGKGVMSFAGERSLAERVWFDGANPTVDLGSVSEANRWYSFGVYLAPTAHGSKIKDCKVSGVMRGVLASTFPVESIATVSDADALNETLYPSLTNITVDGLECENCWTAFQPISIDGLRIKRVVGNYVAGVVGGADPHLIYAGSVGANDAAAPTIGRPNRDVVWGDCHATGGVLAPAFKMRSCVGLTITGGLTAEGCPGLLDLILIEDFTVGDGCLSSGDISTAQFSVRFLHSDRGTVQPFVIQHTGNLNGTVPLVIVDRCEQVLLSRPRITINPTSADINRWAINIVGDCPGVELDRPEIINRGSNSGNAVRVSDSAGIAGTSSGALIHDPKVTGSWTSAVRLTFSGATVRYDPARLGGTRRIEVDTAATGTIGNLRNAERPDLNPTVLGWHNGEDLNSSRQVAEWPSGHKQAFRFGNDWVGNWDGRITWSASGGRRMAAASFGVADVDITVGVKLATGTRAGICLRANGDSDYLTVTRASGSVKIHKYAAGTATELATVATNLPNNATGVLRAVIVGVNIYVYLDNVQVLTHALAGGDATTYVSSAHGLFGDNAGTSVLFRPTIRAVA